MSKIPDHFSAVEDRNLAAPCAVEGCGQPAEVEVDGWRAVCSWCAPRLGLALCEVCEKVYTNRRASDGAAVCGADMDAEVAAFALEELSA